MTRIFEALRKSRAGALPFPPVESGPLRPAVVPRPSQPAATVAAVEPAVVPRIDAVAPIALSDEVMRQMTAMRVGLEAALEGKTSRTVMFLGSMGGEGVTTVARQFAAVLASEGRRPCVILDAHAAPAAAPAGLRRAAVPLDRAAAAERLPGWIGVATLGSDRTAPAAVRSALAGLTSQYEWVVVDGPPVLEAPESVDLAPLVDGVVLVVRSAHTKRPVALRAVEMLRKSGVRVVGCVLNRRRLEIPDFIYRRI